MAVPTIESLPSLQFLTLDETFSRWPSSSTSNSSASRSTSYADCPSMSICFTGSTSSDTQTENDTPPESPCEQTTPVIRDLVDYSCRPTLRPVTSYISIYSDPEDTNSPDAGYETECEEKLVSGRFSKRTAARRIPVDRRRGELTPLRPAAIAQSRFPTPTRFPTASPLATSTRPPSPEHSSLHASSSRPTKIEIPPPAVLAPRPKAHIGLGLGLGLPSTLSAVRPAPNWVHRSSTDRVPRAGSITPAELFGPVLIPMPTTPRLGPTSPSMTDAISPLSLPSPPALESVPPGAPIQPRHAAFCFAHGVNGGHALTASAFLTIANDVQGPPTRGSRLSTTPEEDVCEGDGMRGIRRFPSMNPYFPTMGYRVTSG